MRALLSANPRRPSAEYNERIIFIWVEINDVLLAFLLFFLIDIPRDRHLTLINFLAIYSQS